MIFWNKKKSVTVKYRISFFSKKAKTMDGQLKEICYKLCLLQVLVADTSSFSSFNFSSFSKILIMHSIWAIRHFYLAWILIAWLHWNNLEFYFWNNGTKIHATRSGPLINSKRTTEETILSRAISKKLIFIFAKLFQILI